MESEWKSNAALEQPCASGDFVRVRFADGKVSERVYPASFVGWSVRSPSRLHITHYKVVHLSSRKVPSALARQPEGGG